MDEQYEKPQPQFPVMGMMKVDTRPEHSKAWAKDIFDHQKHQLVKAIRDRQITVVEINYKNLSHVDLSGVDLSHADLSDVNLFNTNLSGANLSHANLSGANLVKANLSHANLSGVDLSHVLEDDSASQKTNSDEIYLDDMWQNSVAAKNINLDGAILEPEAKLQYLIYKGKKYQTWKSQAIEYLQQALSIVKELGERNPCQKYRSTEAEILCQLANEYVREDEQKAEELYQQALLISQAIGDCYNEAIILKKLGDIYLKREVKLEALNYFQQAQTIFEQLDKRGYIISNLHSIISISENLGSDKYLLAEHYQKLLSFVPKEEKTVNKLVHLYVELGNRQQAFKYLQLSISLQEKSINPQELNYLGAEIYLLKTIIEIYESLNDFSNTLKYYQQLLSLKRNISVHPPEVESFNKIVQVYWYRNDLRNPAQILKNLLRLKTERWGIFEDKKNPIDLCIGKLYLEQGEKQKAIECYERGIVAVRELRKQSGRNCSYCLENLDSDRKRLLKIIDRFKNHSDKTLNLSPYSQKLLQERESDRLEIEQLIEKITTILIMVRYT